MHRLRPFSHRPNTTCLIPTTQFVVRAFPALIQIEKLSGEIIKEIKLNIEGPLKLFTLVQDLERGCVTLFSEQYRFHILPDLTVVDKKHSGTAPLLFQERLDFGSHKKQEWDLVKKRGDLREIFPLWFSLGSQLTLKERLEENVGMFLLLQECKKAIDSHHPETIVPAFKKLFLAGFREMLVPRSFDDEHQGILASDQVSKSSPLYLLSEGAQLIRSLFLHSSGNEFSILPNLPPEFFAGQMLHLACPSFGTLDLVWSKKSIRTLHFHAHHDGEILFHFNPRIRSFRLGNQRHQCGDILEIKSGCLYVLDQFQK